jgi:hypothetical protein
VYSARHLLHYTNPRTLRQLCKLWRWSSSRRSVNKLSRLRCGRLRNRWFVPQQSYETFPARQFPHSVSDPRVLIHHRWRRIFPCGQSIRHLAIHFSTVFRLRVIGCIYPFLHAPSWFAKRHTLIVTIYPLFPALSLNSSLLRYRAIATGILLPMFR